MTNKSELVALAEMMEDDANLLLRRADAIWGWRRRDRQVSIAIGDTSRALRRIAAALRSSAATPTTEGV